MLKTHNPEAIYSLKDFLTIVPNPEKIKQILIAAIYQLMETEPETIYWLLKNPTYLQPEIDIKFIVTQKLYEKLITWGFTPEDIYFNENGNLEFNAATKDRLLSANYSSDNGAILTLIKFFLTELI
ncbi:MULTISPECIES: hypothetical protein [unclassified Anabaena]|uniref:hypothetical protein n=1 Tax=unclassified Anabaena TaxID=2619674 RepID=UPI0014473F8B|nr:MULTISPECIES: hypothetical protein [unclassified Anabaena]MTJ07235.1 hypothetical protein [Anabaena sp. UHCC 0204]